MHIGLIGGIGPAATDFYHRRLIAAFAARGAPLDLTIVHADSPTLLRHQAADDRESQVAICSRVTARLVAAGADCVAVTSIAGHSASKSSRPSRHFACSTCSRRWMRPFTPADSAGHHPRWHRPRPRVSRPGDAVPVVDCAAIHVDAIVASATA